MRAFLLPQTLLSKGRPMMFVVTKKISAVSVNFHQQLQQLQHQQLTLKFLPFFLEQHHFQKLNALNMGGECDGTPCEGWSDCCNGYNCRDKQCVYSSLVMDKEWRAPMEWLYGVVALLMIVLLTVNITCLALRTCRRNTNRNKDHKFEAVRAYDSEDQDARIPIAR